jgi:transposase
VFVGIDVAKDKLDLARSDNRQLLTVANDEKGVGQIIKLLKDIAPACIVVEATGGFERLLVNMLIDQQLPVAVVNPSRVRHLAISLNILAKSDPIDAHVLSQFARLAEPRLAQKRSANQAELDALITCRRQLVCARTDQGNCRLATPSKTARQSIDSVLKTLDKQIELLDQKIRQLINSDDDFKQLNKVLTSAPGVGPVLSSTLLAEVSELPNHRPQADWRAGRSRAVRSRLGNLQRQAIDPRRTNPGAQRVVHGHRRGHALQSGAEGFCRQARQERQTRQSDHRRLHAKAAGIAERDGA